MNSLNFFAYPNKTFLTCFGQFLKKYTEPKLCGNFCFTNFKMIFHLEYWPYFVLILAKKSPVFFIQIPNFDPLKVNILRPLAMIFWIKILFLNNNNNNNK